MAIEQGVGDDRRILLIDCGLMFPDPDMHGIDLVLPDFTYLRENADAHRRPRRHPRPRGPRRRHAVPAARGERADLRLGADARPGPQPHRGGRAARAHRAQPRRRRRARSASAPFDVEFIPVTHSVPHAHAIAVHTPQGVILHSGDFKLDLTPVDDRRTDLARIGADRQDRGHPRPAVRLDQRRGGRLRAERDAASGGSCARSSPSTATGGSSRPASPATSTASSRSPTPPSPAGARSPRSG